MGSGIPDTTPPVQSIVAGSSADMPAASKGTARLMISIVRCIRTGCAWVEAQRRVISERVVLAAGVRSTLPILLAHTPEYIRGSPKGLRKTPLSGGGWCGHLDRE